MLLYTKTDEETQPDGQYMMSGNRITVKTLNLDCEFKEIADQLDEIAKEQKYWAYVSHDMDYALGV